MPTRALVAGINAYGGRNTLPSCVKDATSFAEMLQKDLGLQSGDIKSLIDQQATKDGLKAGLKWLFDGAGSQDRLVFYYSGHGYQPVIGGELREALVTQDGQFFDDAELADAMSSVPNGVLTIVLDTCFSGGLEKVFIDGEVHLGQSKSWTPPDSSADATKGFTPSTLGFRPFGSIPPTAFKGYVPGAGVNLTDLTLPASKGLLVTAAQANETASASMQGTNGMSAFTFALLEQVEQATKQSATRSTLSLVSAAADTLTDMGVGQTPTVKQPITPPNMGELSFLSLSSLKPAMSSKSLIQQPSEITMNQAHPSFPASLLSDIAGPGRPIMSVADVGSKDWWGGLSNVLASTLPVAIQAATQGKGFTPSAEVGSKGWWDGVSGVLAATLPAAINAATQGKGFTPNADVSNKDWLGGLSGVLAATLPAAIQAATQGKGFNPSGEVGSKDWLSGLSGVLAATLPVAMQAATQGKGFTPSAEVGSKGWWDGVSGVLAATLPVAIQAATQGKGFTPNADVSNKDWLSGLSGVLAATLPAAIQAATQGKGFNPSAEVGSKGWWDGVSGVLAATLPVAIQAATQGKGFTPNADVSNKDWLSGLSGVLAATLPAAIQAATQGKGFNPSGEVGSKDWLSGLSGVLAATLPAAIQAATQGKGFTPTTEVGSKDWWNGVLQMAPLVLI